MRAISRFLFVLMLAVLASPALPGATVPAQAACETSASLEAALDRANSVFVGEVTVLADSGRTATMRVIEVWKGRDLAGTVVVEGSASDGSPQNHRTWQTGRTYLVESRDTRPPFESDRCTATKIYNPLGGRQIPANLATVIGTTQARPPLSTPGDGDVGTEGGTSWLPFINVGLVLAGIIGVIWMYKKVTKVESRKAREAAAQAKAEKAAKPQKAGTSDPLAKVSRKLSVTGSIGRSGLESSRKLRGKRTKAVSRRGVVIGSKKSKKSSSGDDGSDS